MSRLDPGPDEQIAYLSVLVAAAKDGQFLDVRWRRPGGAMHRRFLSALRPEHAGRVVARLAGSNEVYVGVALREGNEHGGRAAIRDCHLAYVESDDPGSAQRLASFRYPPSMVVASGTPGHLQVYWRLEDRCSPSDVEGANRSLALVLAADPACADVARVLRPPGTLNHKRDPPGAVKLLIFRPNARYSLAQLTDGLPEDRHLTRVAEGTSRPRRVRRTPLDRDLLAIAASEYVRTLTGRSPNHEGKVLCPFHEDGEASLQLYLDGSFYCFGSGCRAGGTIFDFAARLWGLSSKGIGFIELRRRLALCFELDSLPTAERVGPRSSAARPQHLAHIEAECR